MSSKSIKDYIKKYPVICRILVALLIFIGLVLITLLGIKMYTRHGIELELPDFTRQSYEEVSQNPQYSDYAFMIVDSVYNPQRKNGEIIEQNPMAQERVKSGRKVYLTLAITDPPLVSMPDLVNLSFRQAESNLKKLGLKMNPPVYKASLYENAVLEQLYKGRTITSGTEIKMGESITLVVGRKTGEEYDNETDEE